MINGAISQKFAQYTYMYVSVPYVCLHLHTCIGLYTYLSLYIFVSKPHLYLPRRLQAGIYIEMHTYKCIFEFTCVHMFRVRLLIFIHTYVLHILLQISTGVKAWLQKKGLWENPNGSARAGKKKKLLLGFMSLLCSVIILWQH